MTDILQSPFPTALLSPAFGAALLLAKCLITVIKLVFCAGLCRSAGDGY
jgi:hypothetical protein